jgi:hypothetical protein
MELPEALLGAADAVYEPDKRRFSGRSTRIDQQPAFEERKHDDEHVGRVYDVQHFREVYA